MQACAPPFLQKIGTGTLRLLAATLCMASVAYADSAPRPLLVDAGRANAQIVIAENPPRLVDLAARELQATVKKITGAELPITTNPGNDYPFKIFVGQSPYTDRLGIKSQGLDHGAYRITSGPDWLALIGEDYDFVPPDPWAKSRSPDDQAEATAAWDKITGKTWVNPMWALWRRYNKETGLWQQDEGGSLNAVVGFLHDLGVRWYMPGELGEVIPQMPSIALPEIDRTVHPDYPLRYWFGSYMAFHPDTVMWDRRLGMNSGHRILGAALHVHGLRHLYERPEVRTKHPEFFAQVGGKVDHEHVNLLSEPLVQEAANYARASFDHFGEPAVSIWPADGLRQCETSPPMPQSDYVGQFMDRVARETLKTHPDRVLTFGAYSGYRQPPANVAQFPPNTMVFVAAHRPGLMDPEMWAERMVLVEGWKKKTPNRPIIRNSNNYYEFVIHPRSFARELKALKGISLGDWNEVRRRAEGKKQVVWNTPGLDHLNQYVNARFLWDADQDIEALLDEYHTLFFGPARDKTKEAFDFAEANYTFGEDGAKFSTKDRIVFVEKLLEARKKVEGTIYARRIDAILAEAKSPGELRAQLDEENAARERKDAPLALAASGAGATPETYSLREIRTGDPADVKTTFQVRWENDHLVFDILCHEPDMKNTFSSKDVWSGDSVAVLIESRPGTGDYYQIEINPDGQTAEASRREHKGTINLRWNSQAKTEIEKGDDFWRVRASFPIMGPDAGALDPLHNIVGSKPTAEDPWYFQVGRVRVRDGKRTAFTFNPTGGGYHDMLKFGRLEVAP